MRFEQDAQHQGFLTEGWEIPDAASHTTAIARQTGVGRAAAASDTAAGVVALSAAPDDSSREIADALRPLVQ